MKRMFLCLTALFFVLPATAQTKTTTKKKFQTASKTQQKKNTQKSTNYNTVILTSESAYPAKKTSMNIPVQNLSISDPILNALDARAAGADIRINKSGIVGMPKRAFGIANGKIYLGTTGSVTSGTQTGSGSVGTGTGLGTFGSTSSVMGVNGKSPYAGLSMWGNASNIFVGRGDGRGVSGVRLMPAKQ